VEALYEAVFNKDHKILGYRLTAYSADHLFALESIDSPFIKESGHAEPVDLIRALKICSRTKLHEPVCLNRWDMFIVWLTGNSFVFRYALAKYSSYLVDHNAFPDFWEDLEIGEGKGGGLTGNPILARVLSVMRKCPSLGEARAWQMPVGLLVWYDEQAGELDNNGRRFWHPGEEAEIEESLKNRLD